MNRVVGVGKLSVISTICALEKLNFAASDQLSVEDILPVSLS